MRRNVRTSHGVLWNNEKVETKQAEEQKKKKSEKQYIKENMRTRPVKSVDERKQHFYFSKRVDCIMTLPCLNTSSKC